MRKKIMLFITVLFLFFISTGFPSYAGETEKINTDRIIVKFKQGHRIDAASINAKRLKGPERTFTIRLEKGENMDSVIKKYKNRSDVEYVQPDYKRYAYSLDTESTPVNWGVARVGADDLSERISGENTSVVAVLDTGIYAEHPLLSGRVLPGYDCVNGDSTTEDGMGHGTHVAGIVAMVAGSQPVNILPVKVLGNDGSGYDSDIAQGIYYAVGRGADVINLSLGGPGSSPVLEEAVQYAVDNGVVVVAAAGNQSDNASYYTPAGIEECVTVSAVNRYDTLTAFSNYGYVVDIAAPGKGIVSSVPGFADTDGIPDGYIAWDGTSMAAPFVAGIAGLLRVQNGKLTVSEIGNLLYGNADDVGDVGKDQLYGYGIIDFSDYLVDADFDVVSPDPYTEHYETLQVKVIIYEEFSGIVRCKIDGELYADRDISQQDEVTTILTIEDLAEGEHTLTVELRDTSGELYGEKQVPFIVKKPVAKIDFKVYDYYGYESEGAIIHLFEIKNDTPSYLDSKLTDGYGRASFEMGDAEKYLAVVYHETDVSVPLYVREINTPGQFDLTADNISLLSLSYDAVFNPFGARDVFLHPVYNGKPLGYIYIGYFYTSGDIPLDDGNYYLEIIDPDGGYYFDNINIYGDTDYTISDSDLATLTVDYDESKESPYLMPVPSELEGYYTWQFDLYYNNSVKLLKGDYGIEVERFVKTGNGYQRYLFERDVNLSYDGSLELGYKIKGDINLDNNSLEQGQSIAGSINITDEYGNRLIGTNTTIESGEMKRKKELRTGKLLERNKNKVEKTVKKRRREKGKLLEEAATSPLLPEIEIVDSSGTVVHREQISFEEFNISSDSVQEGSYGLGLHFSPPGLTYSEPEITEFTVGSPGSPLEDTFADYMVLGEKRTGAPLNHTFTVRFSAAVDAATVNTETLQLYRYDTAEIVPVLIQRENETTFKMTPQSNLLPGTRYWVVIKPGIRGETGSELRQGVIAEFLTVK